MADRTITTMRDTKILLSDDLITMADFLKPELSMNRSAVVRYLMRKGLGSLGYMASDIDAIVRQQAEAATESE